MFYFIKEYNKVTKKQSKQGKSYHEIKNNSK